MSKPLKKSVILVAVSVVVLVLGAISIICFRDRAAPFSSDPNWVLLDLTNPDMRAAVDQARASLPGFTERVPRYDPNLEPGITLQIGADANEKPGRIDGNSVIKWRDSPEGPQFAVRARVIGYDGHMPHIWLTHVRYDAEEDLYWGFIENVPSDLPAAFGRYIRSVGVPPRLVVDWRIITGDRVEGAFTTTAQRNAAAQAASEK